MNTKPPVRLGEMMAVNMKIQPPLTLNEIPQAVKSRQPGNGQPTSQNRQPVNRAEAAPQNRPPINRAQAAPQNRPPVNRAEAAPQNRPPVNRAQAAPQNRPPVNRAQAIPPRQPENRTQNSQILPGVKAGMEMKKGQKASLAQKNPSLAEIEVCLGWRVQNPACDLDASAFLLGADNKVPGEEWFVFYGQTESPDGSVRHHGDNRNGTGCGDMESISIQLKRVHPNVKKIVFIITINEALKKGLNFGMVSDTYIRVVDKSANSEIVRYVLNEYYSNVTSMIVGEIYERNGEWKFNAVGNGVARDLPGLCELYGVQASY